MIDDEREWLGCHHFAKTAKRLAETKMATKNSKHTLPIHVGSQLGHESAWGPSTTPELNRSATPDTNIKTESRPNCAGQMFN